MTDRNPPIGVLSWFIARRYLFQHQRKALASTITLIAVIGIAIGVASLIVTLGVMEGAEVQLYGKMARIFPGLKISSSRGSDPIALTRPLMDAIQGDPDVVFVEPVLSKEAILLPENGIESQKKFVQLIGADNVGANEIYKGVVRPKPTGASQSADLNLDQGQVLIGSALAAKMKIGPGDKARVISTGVAKQPGVSAPPDSIGLRVKAVFDTGYYAFDANTAFISTADARRLLGFQQGTANYLYVRLKDPFKAREVRDRINLEGKFPGQFTVKTGDQISEIFSAIKLEKICLFLILMLIILVAAFNVIGTLILMVIEKTRAVGILRACGATEGLILRVFLLDGISIGGMGTLLGVVLGVTIGLLIPVIKIKMPPSVYNFDHLPIQINILTVAIIIVSSMAISTLAAFIPARQAAKLNPVEALRYD